MTTKRPFSIEKHLGNKGLSPHAEGKSFKALEAPADSEDATLAEIKKELKIIRLFLESNGKPDLEEVLTDEEKDVRDQMKSQEEEITELKTQLKALAYAIQQTKIEIAAIHPNDESLQHIEEVSTDLDTIVSATEKATETILECAEQIDAAASTLQAQTSDAHMMSLADEISEAVIRVFEACNFQDLTGQRITKALKTLAFVEERIVKMIDIWGDESFDGIAPDIPPMSQTEDGHLLNGPSTEEEGGIDQNAIDALFD